MSQLLLIAAALLMVCLGLGACAGTGSAPGPGDGDGAPGPEDLEAPGSDLPPGTLERGVSRELARHRKERIAEVDYDLSIRLDRESATFEGTVKISFDLLSLDGPVVLDFKGKEVLEVQVAGGVIQAEAFEDHLVIDAEAFTPGRNTVAIRYRGGVGAGGEGIIKVVDEDDGSVYLYTLNVPSDGHAVLPCFDQPDLKGRFRLEVSAPPEWRVVSNAPELATVPDPDSGLLRWAFQPTEPISTYLFAFAAGPFEQVVQDAGGRKLRFFGRRSQKALLEQHAEAAFDLHRKSLAWCEETFAMPYPFKKLDFLCVPDFPFSGMEHPGCIFYGEAPVLFRSEPTLLEELRRADLIAHEVSHMWFGDLVTMPWFDDVWLKEGFATYMAHKALSSFFEGVDHDRNFFLRNHPAALDTDVTPGARPIRLPLGNLDSAKSNYGPIIYRKGPVVLRQLELMIGSPAFLRGVRTFLSRHAYDCGRWEELKACFEEATVTEGVPSPGTPTGPGSLDAWSKAWIESAGVPRVVASVSEDGRAVDVRQEALDGSGRLWPLGLEVSAWRGDRLLAKQPVSFSTRSTQAPLALDAHAELVWPNHGAAAYALFLLDPPSLRQALSGLEGLGDPLLRTMVWQALWGHVQAGEIEPGLFVILVLRHVFSEDDQRLISTLLSRAAWTLENLEPEDRERRTRGLETLLERAMDDPSLDRGIRLICFRKLAEVAATPEGLGLLRELFDGVREPGDLPVSKPDRWAMLQRLMLLGDEGAEARLARMRREDESDDGRRRAFLVECARPDAASKQALFRRFFDDPDLPERWVQNGAEVFFHVRHAALTDRFLAESLERLDWIKANRKIFFLPAFVEALVRTRTTAAARDRIRAYVEAPRTQEDIATKVRVPLHHLSRKLEIRGRSR